MQKKAWIGAKKRPLWKQGPKPKLTAYEKNLFFYFEYLYDVLPAKKYTVIMLKELKLNRPYKVRPF
jgi:hypothetical protein